MKDIDQLSDPDFLKELYRQLFSNSSDPLFICDTQFRFTECNNAFHELFHKEDDSPRKEVLADLFFKESELDNVLRHLEQHSVLDDLEVILKDYEGERILALISLVRIEDVDGSLVGYQGIVHDETRRLSAQRKLARAQKLAFTGRMVRTIAHEIRNPLTNVSLALASIKDGELSDDDMMMLGIIESNANRINELITELLDSSRPAELVLEPVILQELVASALKMAKDRMELQNIVLECDFLETNIPVEVDVPKMKLALNNLFINAIEAMESGGCLSVTIARTSKRAWVTIADTGSGMSKEVLNHLFDPYFTTRPNGTGLGLTSVQNILDSHGWNIDVDSEEGIGTTFTLSVDL